MPNELKILRELQTYDTKIIKERDIIDNIPKKISEYELPYKEALMNIEKKKKDVESALKQKRDLELNLKEIADNIDKQKARITSLKTNREYSTHIKEIEKIEADKSKLEDKLLMAMENVDKLNKEAKEAEKTLGLEKKKIEEKKKFLEQDQIDLTKDLKSLLSKRNKLAKTLDRTIYNQYMDLLENKYGLAVVEVRDEVCHGCNLNIQPQIYAEVIKNERLHRCLQCGRYIYYDHEAANQK
ncbi:MAG: hypothetical protein HQK91_09295 [Nitrospirae bacterium]|nr:hypothetical protein [Nitrospirota bacterium]MBF0541626.1 hypothetical protein [Nitrospirota bacterium]